LKRKKSTKTNTRKLDRETKALMLLPEKQIDTSDVPELTDCSKAIVGKFFRPIKKRV